MPIIQTSKKGSSNKVSLSMARRRIDEIKKHPRIFAGVIGFTDPSGRTSCATTEQEHYRLRTIGLREAAISTRALGPTIESMLSTFRTSGPALGWENYAYGEGAMMMRAAIEDAQERHKDVNEEFEQVIRRYGNALHPNLCAKACPLPFEIFYMVYHNLREMSRDIEVVATESCASSTGENEIAYREKMTLRPSSHIRQPWFCSPDIVGDAFACKALKAFYQTSRFQISDAVHLEPFLNTAMWGPVAPKNFLRRMEVDVPLLDYYHPAQLEETRSHLTYLGDFDNSDASVTLSLGCSSIIVPKLILENAQADADRAFVKTGTAMSAEWWTTMHDAVAREAKSVREHKKWLLRTTVQYFLPIISKLVQRGSTVKLKIGWSGCEYSLEENKLGIDELMKAWLKE